MAKRIVDLFPPHLAYVEPFAGGLAVLLARNPDDPRLWYPGHKGCSEVVNDINKNLTVFWKVLRGEESFTAFKRLCEATPFSECEWNDADLELHECPVPDEGYSSHVIRAWRFFVHCRQSMSGRMEGFTPICRNRLRRGMNGNVSEWIGAVDGLPAVHARLRRVMVLDARPALDVIRKEDTPGTLFYIDPPYCHDTRTAPNVYKHEMTSEDHRELLETLRQCKGKVMLSGYANDLYDTELKSWNRHAFDLPNNSAAGKVKQRRTEVLWCNY